MPGGGSVSAKGLGTPPAWHNLPSPASPRKTFLLEIHLKKKKKKIGPKPPTNTEKRTINNYQESFLKSPLQKKGKEGEKKQEAFFSQAQTLLIFWLEKCIVGSKNLATSGAPGTAPEP